MKKTQFIPFFLSTCLVLFVFMITSHFISHSWQLILFLVWWSPAYCMSLMEIILCTLQSMICGFYGWLRILGILTNTVQWNTASHLFYNLEREVAALTFSLFFSDLFKIYSSIYLQIIRCLSNWKCIRFLYYLIRNFIVNNKIINSR